MRWVGAYQEAMELRVREGVWKTLLPFPKIFILMEYTWGINKSFKMFYTLGF
jgi:hypothetical protein